ncbi:Flp pilus assembly protein CpaB [Desulfobotulus sp.]|uniref:Flp pilus assembly protein CpaB n=1 Tax=Desulfobotulus sp. TaxID=1940337 RepID=UPI002A36A157|nr:Flp pilus assembly protein CpaB [Desulfobotulus sp.]MDY0164710.1 Flp pilus assembly protein CpaB [Desulfobotulus sp.]
MRAFIPVLLSILIALGGSYLLYDWLKKQQTPENVVISQDTRAVPVVTSKLDLVRGSEIDPMALETKPYFKESLPGGYFSDPAALTGRIVTSSMMAGEPILESRLADTTITRGGIPALLKPGSRAVSVQGNKVLGLAGHIKPDDRVDVLLTIQKPDTEKEFTKTILENMLVLASGTQIVKNADSKAAPVDVYTLEVTPDQGERLTLAANEGRLQFALRGAVDHEIVPTKGVTMVDVLEFSSPTESNPKLRTVVRTRPAPKKVKKTTIETIKGLTLTQKDVPLKDAN